MYNIIEKFHLVAVIKRVSGVADHEEISLKLCSGKNNSPSLCNPHLDEVDDHSLESQLLVLWGHVVLPLGLDDAFPGEERGHPISR